MNNIRLYTKISGWTKDGKPGGLVESEGHLNIQQACAVAKESGLRVGLGAYITITHEAEVLDNKLWEGNLSFNSAGQACSWGDLSDSERSAENRIKKQLKIDSLSPTEKDVYESIKRAPIQRNMLDKSELEKVTALIALGLVFKGKTENGKLVQFSA